MPALCGQACVRSGWRLFFVTERVTRKCDSDHNGFSAGLTRSLGSMEAANGITSVSSPITPYLPWVARMEVTRARGEVPMSLPDPQLSRWLMYAAGTAASTILFIGLGMSDVRRMNRAATRLGVLSAIATVLCMTAGISTILLRGSGPTPSEPEKIEWCKRISCSLGNAAQVPGRH